MTTSATGDPLLDGLVAKLASLDELERARATGRFLEQLGDAPAPPLGHDAHGNLVRRPTKGLEIAHWAEDEGGDADRSRLGVHTGPRSHPVAKTENATGDSLLSNGSLGADVLRVPAGAGFAPHTHPGDHLLFILGGRGTITVDGRIFESGPGQVYMIDGFVPHAVGAIDDHVILAVGSPHRAIDSPERQILTSYEELLTSFGELRCTICNVVACDGEELGELGCAHGPVRP